MTTKPLAPLLALGLLAVGLVACGDSRPENPPPAVQAPAAPTGLRVSPGDGVVTLEWEPSGETDLASYRLYRGASEALDVRSLSPLVVLEPADTRYDDLAVENGSLYYYALTTVNFGGGESEPSEVVRAEPQEEPTDPGEPGDGGFTTIAWSRVQAAPLAVTEAQGAVVDGELYVFGGYDSFDPFTTTTAAHAFNPATGTWRPLADLPAPLTHAGVVVDGRDLYFAGAYINPNDPDLPRESIVDGSHEVYRYNLDEDAWYLEPDMALPEARGSGGFVLLGRDLHFFGGHDQARVDRPEHWVLSLDDVAAGWRLLDAPFPNPRNHMGYVTLGGKIYAVGGQYGARHASITLDLVHSFDPATGEWQAETPLPDPLSHHTAATFIMDGRIVVVAGEREHEVFVNQVLAYDPVAREWTRLTSLPQPHNAGVGGVIGGELFYTTGGVTAMTFSTTTYRGVPLD